MAASLAFETPFLAAEEEAARRGVGAEGGGVLEGVGLVTGMEMDGMLEPKVGFGQSQSEY